MTRKYPFLALLGLSLAFLPHLSADEVDAGFDFNDYSAENIKATSTPSMFSISVDADFIGKSRINNGFYKDDKIGFRTVDVQASAGVYYNACYKEGLQLILGYQPFWIEWSENPWVDQKGFQVISLGLGGVTERVRNWVWRGEVQILTDAKEFEHGFRYVFYNFLGWGRYTASSNLGLHFGLIGEVGMRTDRVYPIVGVDWQISQKWKLNAVFPVNVSIDYQFNKNWMFSLAGRTFSFRDRAAKGGTGSERIVRYSNAGAELAATYVQNQTSLSVHGGVTLGGRVRIASPSNHHPRHYKVDGAPYAGAEVSVRF